MNVNRKLINSNKNINPKKMSAITINLPDDSQINVIKAFLKALKIKFSIASNEITNPAILKSINEYENGKSHPTPMNLEELKFNILK